MRTVNLLLMIQIHLYLSGDACILDLPSVKYIVHHLIDCTPVSQALYQIDKGLEKLTLYRPIDPSSKPTKTKP